jgi:hypothetical protein
MTYLKKLKIPSLCLILSTVLPACGSGGGSPNNGSSSKWVTVGANDTALISLTFDPVTNTLYGANTSGQLCSLSINASTTTSWNCNLTTPPSSIQIIPQGLATDGKGAIYAIAYSLNKRYMLEYSTQTGSWKTHIEMTKDQLFFSGKAIYRNGKVYLSSWSSLVILDTVKDTLNLVENFFNPYADDFSGSTIDDNGNFYYKQINGTTYAKNLSAAPGTLANQFGSHLKTASFSDLNYINGNVYTCDVQNLYRLPVGSNAQSAWNRINSAPTFTIAKMTLKAGCKYITDGNGSLVVYSEVASPFGGIVGQVFKLKF